MSNLKKPQSFQNSEVILATYGDKRLVSLSSSPCWFEQDADGPTFIVIRPQATDDQLEKLSTRFKLTVDKLKSFRALSI